MTPTTNIMAAFFSQLETAFLGIPISWPGADFTPPDSGEWLEAEFFPNEPEKLGIALADYRAEVGILQVSVVSRPGPNGFFTIAPIARDVIDAFPIGHTITGPIRVSQEPSVFKAEAQGPDRIMLVVSIPYRG